MPLNSLQKSYLYFTETVFCPTPSPSIGQLLNYSSTSYDSIIEYDCMDGYLPQLLFSARCNIMGRWEPDPANHSCNIAQAHGNIIINAVAAFE